MSLGPTPFMGNHNARLGRLITLYGITSLRVGGVCSCLCCPCGHSGVVVGIEYILFGKQDRQSKCSWPIGIIGTIVSCGFLSCINERFINKIRVSPKDITILCGKIGGPRAPNMV
jgi:hypothetical protein